MSSTVLTAAANVTINNVIAMISSTLCSPMPFIAEARCDANIRSCTRRSALRRHSDRLSKPSPDNMSSALTAA